MFSKMSSFSLDEIGLSTAAQRPFRPRVILLSARELELYDLYESAEKEFDVKRSVSSLNI
jgi:hypothetical protein